MHHEKLPKCLSNIKAARHYTMLHDSIFKDGKTAKQNMTHGNISKLLTKMS